MSISLIGFLGDDTKFPTLEFIEILLSEVFSVVTVILLLIAQRMAVIP